MADSKRKTANLFDKSNGSYNAYVDDAGTWRYVDTAKSVKIPCSANTTYTLSVPENLSVFRIYEISDASAEPPTQATEIIRSGGTDNYTFTTASTTAAIIFQGSAGNFDEWFNGLMLNTGGTPLPYEPYGWLHSLRKLTTATDTITTLPADLYADGTNATVGLVGNMSQSGTPTPQNPIQPSECGERTNNLFDYQTGTPTAYKYLDENGNEVVVTELAPWYITDYIPIPDGVLSVTLSKIGGGLPAMCAYDASKNYITGIKYNTGSAVTKVDITLTSSTPIRFIRFSYFLGNTGYDDISTKMLNTGSTALPYQPYGYVLPVKSGNTTTPVYLGEVESTRQIKKLVLTGDELFTINASGNNTYFAHTLIKPSIRTQAEICTHLTYATIAASNTDVGFSIIANGTELRIRIPNAATTSLADFKAYLAQQYAAGTPVTVWYVLATPQTAVVNEPIRKIGDYADTVSGTTIPTIAGADSFDVLTTLKPSEVSLTYTGWHDASVGEWDGSQWQ